MAEWNLRKCSAATLDLLSHQFVEKEFLDTLLPLINQQLTSDSWLHRECGILALGAIADGKASFVSEMDLSGRPY